MGAARGRGKSAVTRRSLTRPKASDTQRVLSTLVGQGIATAGLLLYAVLVGPLVPHDGVGGFISRLLLGTIIEGYRRAR